MAADPDELEAGDRRLLAALYRDDADDADDGDADGAGEACARDVLADDARDRLAGWEGVRGALRQARSAGFDDEPPATGPASMAALMAAARAHAPKPKDGLWARLSRWMMPMIAHPALAGAAALVVVGGAAGVLYLRGKHKVARPNVAEVQPRPLPTSPGQGGPTLPASPLTDGELGDVLGKRLPSERPGPARVELGQVGGAPGNGVRSSGGGEDQGEGGGPRGHKTKAVPTSGSSPQLAPTDPVVRFDDTGVEGPKGGAAGDGVTVSDEQRFGTELGEAESPPPPPPPPPPPSPSPAAEEPDDKATTTTAPKPPTTTAPKPATAPVKPTDTREVRPADRVALDRLTAAARTAAAAGDCAKVAELSKQVADLDPAYHRGVFSRDAAIARCR